MPEEHYSGKPQYPLRSVSHQVSAGIGHENALDLQLAFNFGGTTTFGLIFIRHLRIPASLTDLPSKKNAGLFPVYRSPQSMG